MLRKVRRLRGSRTMGYGRVGQHRKSGSKGGKGKAGLHKHKWTWTVKYAKEYFRRDSLKPSKRREVKRWINVGDLDALAGVKRRTRKEALTLNLTEIGYGKLLGGGMVKGKYNVVVGKFTESAKEKIEKAGGEISVQERAG